MTQPLPVGTRIVKTNTDGDDTHKDGDPGMVVGILGQMPEDCPETALRGIWGYFVEWDDIPGVPVFVAGTRIKEIINA